MGIQKGDMFPVSSLTTTDGKSADLGSSKAAVFYFYPKDDTPGCTIEANEFTAKYEEFRTKEIAVFGVSADNADSHQKFCDKFGITFPLLIDEGGKVGQEIENWKGAVHARTTYVVDASGKVVEVYDSVNPKGHAEEVFAAASQI